MSNLDKRLLPASVLMAVIVGASALALAQAPGTQSPEPPAKPVSQPVNSTSTTTRQVTPEQLGDSLMAHQRYQAAIEAYKKAPKNDAAAWNKMGIAYQLMFNLTDAMHCYRTSHKLDPKNSNVINNLGTVYDALKQYHNAEKMYKKAIKIDPDSALIRKNLGTNLLAQHKYDQGWQQYVAALKLDPEVFGRNSLPRVENPASISDRGAMNYYMAKGCVRAGMPDRAVEYLRMAINEGYITPKKVVADNEFATLHDLPAFKELISLETQKER